MVKNLELDFELEFQEMGWLLGDVVFAEDQVVMGEDKLKVCFVDGKQVSNWSSFKLLEEFEHTQVDRLEEVRSQRDHQQLFQWIRFRIFESIGRINRVVTLVHIFGMSQPHSTLNSQTSPSISFSNAMDSKELLWSHFPFGFQLSYKLMSKRIEALKDILHLYRNYFFDLDGVVVNVILFSGKEIKKSRELFRLFICCANNTKTSTLSRIAALRIRLNLNLNWLFSDLKLNRKKYAIHHADLSKRTNYSFLSSTQISKNQENHHCGNHCDG